MLTHLTLSEMAAGIRSRALSPVDLVEAHLTWIERRNPVVNAFVMVLADEARRAARDAERRLMEHRSLGLLDGVPLTVKDTFDVEGLPTTCGSRFFAGVPARRDSGIVRRLRAAGTVLLGKTNTPEFMASYETDNYVTGRTNNPWDLDRTPGGSSGGEAAAIAAHMSPGGVGTDGGGSIRLPAHFTGIVGLKPTPGRVSTAGCVPPVNHPTGMMVAAGPMARTARDVRLMFEALAGYDPDDPFSAPVTLSAPVLEGVHIGVMEQFPGVPVTPEIREAVRRAAESLKSVGFTIGSFAPTGIERAPNIWSFLFSDLPARATKALIAGREQDAHWTGTELLDRALAKPAPTAAQVLEMLAARDRMRSDLLRQMESFPVLLLPAAGIAAFRHRERRWPTGVKDIGQFEAVMPLVPFNLLGLPAMVVPFGMSPEGLPLGVQLVGRPYQDELLLEIAVRLEEERGPFPGPAGY